MFSPLRVKHLAGFCGEGRNGIRPEVKARRISQELAGIETKERLCSIPRDLSPRTAQDSLKKVFLFMGWLPNP